MWSSRAATTTYWSRDFARQCVCEFTGLNFWQILACPVFPKRSLRIVSRHWRARSHHQGRPCSIQPSSASRNTETCLSRGNGSEVRGTRRMAPRLLPKKGDRRKAVALRWRNLVVRNEDERLPAPSSGSRHCLLESQKWTWRLPEAHWRQRSGYWQHQVTALSCYHRGMSA